jgi:hypothetical protein
MSDPAEIAALLTASRAAHERAKMARMSKTFDVATAELTTALDLRVSAHQLDPGHTAPAWASEVPSHEVMMEFYMHKLGV